MPPLQLALHVERELLDVAAGARVAIVDADRLPDARQPARRVADRLQQARSDTDCRAIAAGVKLLSIEVMIGVDCE